MSTPTVIPRYPFESEVADQPQGVQNAHRAAFQGIYDLNQALSSLKGQIGDVQTTQKSAQTAAASAPSEQTVTVGQATSIAQTQAATTIATTLGPVNNQTATAYTLQSSDYGGIVTANNAAASTFTLNPVLNSQFFTGMQNLGAGTLTLQPGAGASAAGTINGQPTLDLTQNQGAIVYFDGKNWWAVTSPVDTGFTNPMTTEGDLIVGGTGGTPERLGIGANGTVLTSNGTDPVWSAAAGAGVTDLQGETGSIHLSSNLGTVNITTPSANTINFEVMSGGAVVDSLNTETGAVILASAGGTVAITTPSAGNINLETVASASYLKGTGTISVAAGSVANTTVTVTGAQVGQIALATLASTNVGGTDIAMVVFTAFVTATNTVNVTAYNASPGVLNSITVGVIVFP